MEDFQAVIGAIEVFENTDTADKWKRCLVCGMCTLPNGIAVNTTQLRWLVFKCKLSINGSLNGLGYGLIVTDQSAGEELLSAIPDLRENCVEFRRWTIRTGLGPDRVDRTQSAVKEPSPSDSQQIQSPEEWFYHSVSDEYSFQFSSNLINLAKYVISMHSFCRQHQRSSVLSIPEFGCDSIEVCAQFGQKEDEENDTLPISGFQALIGRFI
jgi:hypothetical protein